MHTNYNSRAISRFFSFDPQTEQARIQACRGVACMLLVAYHVIGDGPKAGMHVGHDSIFRHFTDLLLPIRMPLFTFLSGFVYAYRPVQRASVARFARKKFVRLFLPLVLVTTLTYLYFAIVGKYVPFVGDHRGLLNTILKLYFLPYEHMWFLQALIDIFAVVILLEIAGALATFPRAAVVVALALTAYALGPRQWSSPFSINHATFLLPYFLMGLCANRFRGYVMSRSTAPVIAIVFIGALSVHLTGVLTGSGAVNDTRSLLCTLLGMSTALCAIRWVPTIPWLQRMGGYSFSIYLYHLISAYFCMLVARHFQVDSHAALFVIGFAGGILLPILIAMLAKRNQVTRLMFLGESADRHARDSKKPGAAVPSGA